MAKGSQFERDMCKAFSLWWTKGKRSDVFWRTSGSGARATTRSKKNKKTFGQYGDMQATDPIGQPLIDLCSIEMKHGYKGANPFDCFDFSGKQHPMFMKFIEQCERESEEAGTPYWLLVTRRHSKKTIITMPYILRKGLLYRKSGRVKEAPCVNIKYNKHDKGFHLISSMLLDDFFLFTLPETFESLHRDHL